MAVVVAVVVSSRYLEGRSTSLPMIAPMAPAEAPVEELGGRILGVTPLNLNLAPCRKQLYEETPVISPTARAVPEPPHPHSILSSESYFRSVLLGVFAFNWNPVALHFLGLNGVVFRVEAGSAQNLPRS